MNTPSLPLAIIAFPFLLIACIPGAQVRGTGEVVHRTPDVADFHGIVLEGSMDVELTPSDQRAVEVEAQANIADLLSTEVKDGVWHIDTREGFSTDKPFVIRISLPMIDMVRIEGSGDVEGRGAFKAGRMQLAIAGSGGLILTADVGDLEAEVDGSGGMLISGACGSLNAQVDGSGGIDASGMQAGDATLEVAGSGSIRADVTGEARASIKGSGDIVLMREPAALDKRESGSGEVRIGE